jgi:hypothetical protein
VSDNGTIATTPEELESLLDGIEILYGLAEEGEWERWYFLDEEGRVRLETSDLWAVCWLGRGDTVTTAAAEFPFALRLWTEQDKFYVTAQDDRREGATDRYFVDYAAATPELADRIRKSVRHGQGLTRTREEMLNDPEYPRCAEALHDWERGDDSVIFAVGRSFVQKHQPSFAEARAKLCWGLVDLPSV